MTPVFSRVLFAIFDFQDFHVSVLKCEKMINSWKFWLFFNTPPPPQTLTIFISSFLMLLNACKAPSKKKRKGGKSSNQDQDQGQMFVLID